MSTSNAQYVHDAFLCGADTTVDIAAACHSLSAVSE